MTNKDTLISEKWYIHIWQYALEDLYMVLVRDPFAILLRLGMVYKGHYVYTSGLHGEWYIRIDKGEYKPSPELVGLCNLMAEFSEDTVQVVVSVATGGTTIGRLVAQHLSQLLERTIPFVLLEKEEHAGEPILYPQHLSLVRGMKALFVDDVLNVGTTSFKVVRLIRAVHGELVGATMVWNRGGLRAEDLGVPWLYTPIVHQLPSYPADKCPLCEQGIPVNTDMGHRKEFLAQKAQANSAG